MKGRLIVWFLLLVNVQHAYADHIVGGEIKMERIDAGYRHKVTLLQFWDENKLIIPIGNMGGNRDAKAVLYIYSKRNNQLVDSVVTSYQSTDRVVYQNQNCANTRSMKTVQGTYAGSILLAPEKYSDSEGYFMVWERCCRNSDIDNILDPGSSGMVFYLEFPPVTTTNSTPAFQFPNGQYICVNRPFTMNMSATDDDGDQLVYRLVTPMRGNTNSTGNATVGNAKPKTNYPLITWASGISLANVIPGSQPLSVGEKSGIISVTASSIGLYVFTIECAEFRAGQQIGLVRRDFQLLVIDCGIDKPEPPKITSQGQPATELKFCREKPLQLETEKSDVWYYQWQLNGLNIIGATTNAITVSDPGTYTIIKSYKVKCTIDTASQPVKVTLADPPIARITADKYILCRTDSAILLANEGKPQNPEYEYRWSRNGALTAQNTISLKVGQNGLYGLKISDTILGCTGKDSLYISSDTITVSVPKRVSVMKGKSVSITAKTSPPGNYDYKWSPEQGILSGGNDSTVILSASTSTSYTVVATSENNCQSEAEVEISVFESLHIPSAFSPNLDGHNEVFEILGGQDQIRQVRIFNRWGQVVFHSEGYTDPWDGKFRDELVPAGVYTYIINANFGVVRGNVLLLR